MTPEEQARRKIDAKLAAAGWLVQTKDRTNLAASRGVAVWELSFATGELDCSLFVDSQSIGTVEAKPTGDSLVGVEEQSTKYVTGVPAGPLPWLTFICAHIATSLNIELGDFDYAPFSQRGGLGKAHQLFGDTLPALLEELNLTLAV